MKKQTNKTNQKTTKIIFIVLAVMLFIGIIIFITVNNSGTKIYEVGKDIEAGEYVLVGNDTYTIGNVSDKNYGYYAICSTKECTIDSAAGKDEIITNDNVLGKAYIIVEEGQFLQTKGMKMYKVGEYKNAIKESISYNYNFGYSDYYKVGKDISAGTYTFTGDSFYYAVCSKPSCDVLKNEVIINKYSDTANNSSTVTVENGQYLIISGTEPFTVTK